MKDAFKAFGLIVALICVIGALGFVATSIDFASLKFWGVKYENARREIFEETKSYNEGKAQDLAKYYLEYTQGDQDTKAALSAVIQSQYADYDAKKIKSDHLYNFLLQVRGF